MTGGTVLGYVAAVVMTLVGGYLALAGMGHLGESGDTSRGWSFVGSLLAGLGVALGITVASRR